MRPSIHVSAILLLCSLCAAPCATAAPDGAAERLAALGRVWGQVHYFHPRLAYEEIPWDQAVKDAADAVEQAGNAQALRTAYENLFLSLGDPSTRLEQATDASASASDAERSAPRSTLGDDGILVFHLTDYDQLQDWSGLARLIMEALSNLEEVAGIVFDLRALHGSPGAIAAYSVGYVFDSSPALRPLISSPVEIPGQRQRVHYGLADGPGNVYSSAFSVSGSWRLPATGTYALPIAFLVDERSALPSVALGLQRAGRAMIVAHGAANVDRLLRFQSVDLGYGLRAKIRTSELVFADGTGGFRPDETLAGDLSSSQALTETIALVQTAATPGQARTSQARLTATPLLAPTTRPVATEAPVLPARQDRLLAAYRLWTNVALFFAYHDLMDRPWDDALGELIPAFLDAETPLAYALAICSAMTRLQDGHAYVRGGALGKYFGEQPAAVAVRFIEGRPIITSIAEAAGDAVQGILVGDEIVALDGVPIAERIAHLGPYLAASNAWTHDYYIARHLLRGPQGSVARLTLRREDRAQHVGSVTRSAAFARRPHRTGEVIRLLPGNVGYVDLDRLPPSRVGELFERFANTRAIIFDVRGYPLGTAWPIAPRLGISPSTPTASFVSPVAAALGPDSTRRDTFTQYMARESGVENITPYAGPTIALIDERTQSQAEHSVVAFMQAGTRLVGSATAGANGNVTRFTLAGGITAMFSGLDARHPDGSQLQRVGLTPDLQVLPTIEGVRAGHDEVLAAGLQYLERMMAAQEPEAAESIP